MRCLFLLCPLLVSLGCAGSRPPSDAASGAAAARAPDAGGRAAAAVEEVACPPDIVREPALSAGVRGLSAGEWLQDVSPGALEASVGAQQFRVALPLASGAHEVVGGGGGGVALLRAQPQGACVVNTWGVYLLGKTSLQPAGSWRSADGKLAVLLLSILTQSEGTAPEQRWMVLATDGRRLWPALGEAHQQLMVPGAALRERGGQLQLEVRQSRTSVYAFDPRTGRFVTQ